MALEHGVKAQKIGHHPIDFERVDLTCTRAHVPEDAPGVALPCGNGDTAPQEVLL